MLYELTVSAERENGEYLNFMFDCLKDEIKKTEAVVARSEIDGRLFLSIACAASFDGIRTVAADALSEIFALGFKNEYLRQRLQLGADSLLSRTVLNAMTVLDSSADKLCVKRAVKNENKISLEGFFEFRLRELRQKWDEVVLLANSNSLMFTDKTVVCDFLSFLIDAIPQSVSTVKVAKSGNEIGLVDERGENIPCMRLLYGKQATEEGLLFNIICLSPKKVIIEDESLFSREFKELACRFF